MLFRSRQLRPRKSARHVIAEQWDSDSESEEDDQSYAEELDSEYDFTADPNGY